MSTHFILLVEVAPVIGPIGRRVKRIIIATDKNKNSIYNTFLAQCKLPLRPQKEYQVDKKPFRGKMEVIFLDPTR